MRKVCKILFSLLFGFMALLTPFLSATPITHRATAAETTTTSLDTMLNGIAITQDGYRFSSADFFAKQEDGTTKYYLYVNTAITIINKTPTFNLGISLIYENSDTTPKIITYDNSYSISIQNSQTENIMDVKLQLWPADGSSAQAINLSFTLVQTPINFINSKPFVWKNNINEVVDAPADSFSYDRALTLNINGENAGTENCPIYVDFYFNGEFYSVRKEGDKFYNNITENELYFEDETSKLLTFNVPGQYEVYIYDKTCTKALKSVTVKVPGTETTKTISAFNKYASHYSSYANINSCKFSIKYFSVAEGNTTELGDNMYIIAKSQGNTVVSGQTVNNPVTLQFYNLDAQKIGRIEVTNSHSSLDGSTLPTTEVLFPETYSKISDLQNTTVTYSADGSYTIDIYDKAGNKIWETPFKFVILVDIHNAYNGMYSHDRTLVPKDNYIVSISQTEFQTTIYKGIKEIVISQQENAGEQEGTEEPTITKEIVSLKSSTSTTYYVNLARSNSSINGIEEGVKTEDPVTLTVHGVGYITTKIYRDGTLVETKLLKDGDTITQSAVGKYKVVIYDQMNANEEIVKTFTIKQTLTGATIALIIIGVLGGTIFVITIIRTRSKIKVR